MDNRYSITVSINTFNRPEALKECLSSLSKQTNKNFDVIVVNGGERSIVDKVINELSLSLRLRVIQQTRKGLVEARNLCWRKTKSDLVYIIDDDLVVSTNWIAEINKTFSIDNNIGGVTGPTIINKDEISNRDALSFIDKFKQGNFFWKIIGRFYINYILEGKIREVGRILDSGTFTPGSNYPDCLNINGLLDVDYLEGCFMCFRRELIEKVGGFDYCYTGTSEWSEPDLAFKIKRLGYRLVFNPKAAAEHRVSKQGVFKARTNAYERSVNFITFYFKNIKPNTVRKIVKFHSYLFFMNCYWIYKTIKHKNLNWLSGIWGTFVGLLKNYFSLRV